MTTRHAQQSVTRSTLLSLPANQLDTTLLSSSLEVAIRVLLTGHGPLGSEMLKRARESTLVPALSINNSSISKHRLIPSGNRPQPPLFPRHAKDLEASAAETAWTEAEENKARKCRCPEVMKGKALSVQESACIDLFFAKKNFKI